MNCAQAEMRIYLYGELNGREREETDAHMANCPLCRELYGRANESRVLTKRILQTPAPLPDHPRITRQVMGAIGEMPGKRSWSKMHFFDRFIKPVRYACAALSFFLIVGFLVEQNRVIESRGNETNITSDGTEKMPLNSASFYKSLTEARAEKQISLYECVVRCLYTTRGDCADCNSKVLKYN